jgi:hypothetical protein
MKYNWKKNHEAKANFNLSKIRYEKFREDKYTKNFNACLDRTYKYAYKQSTYKVNMNYTTVVAVLMIIVCISLYMLEHRIVLPIILFTVLESYCIYNIYNNRLGFLKYKKLVNSEFEYLKNLKK